MKFEKIIETIQFAKLILQNQNCEKFDFNKIKFENIESKNEFFAICNYCNIEIENSFLIFNSNKINYNKLQIDCNQFNIDFQFVIENIETIIKYNCKLFANNIVSINYFYFDNYNLSLSFFDNNDNLLTILSKKNLII